MKKAALVFLVVVLVASALPATAGSRAPSNVDPPIISWQPPASYTPASTGISPSYSRASTGSLTVNAEIGSGPVPFFPVTPCRQYDSRSTTKLVDNTPRTVTLSGAPCGIPSTTNAIAVNITVLDITGAGSNGVLKIGTSAPPTTSWINYPFTETQRANAGVVSTNGSGGIVLQVNQGAGSVDVIVDVFGYYPNTNAAHIPTGDYFPIWGDYAGSMMILGRNDEATAANSYGVSGWTYSTGTGSAGIEGEALGASGVVFGVKGSSSSTTAGAAGVYGKGATSGKTYGVFGEATNAVNDNAGVFGKDSHGALAYSGLASSAGVRGEGNNGVVGVSDNIYGVLGVKIAAGPTLQGFGVLGFTSGATQYGVYAFGTLGASGTKPFVEPHPTDPSKVIRYVALEGNEAGTYFRGTTRIVGGTAVIPVPETFKIVTDEEGLTIQVTPVGAPAVVWVESQDLDQIVLRSEKNVTVHYLVQGFRRAYKDWQVVADGVEYMPHSPQETMPAYLSEVVKNRLVQNGTYNADGTVNMKTAERLGWAQKWEERAKAAPAPEVSTVPSNN